MLLDLAGYRSTDDNASSANTFMSAFEALDLLDVMLSSITKVFTISSTGLLATATVSDISYFL